ncbi:MAG: rhodanese-like domain-containing protein [Pseudomonadota bacterium]
MAQIIEFVGNHPFLFLALFTVAGILAWTFMGDLMHGLKKLPPPETVRMMNHEDALVLDIREIGEYEKGHIVNSMNIPSSQLKGRLKRIEKYKKKPVIIHAGTSQQVNEAGDLLKENNFEQLYGLKGGLAAWQEASLPLVTGR